MYQIYKIVNIENDLCYIGSTQKALKNVINDHISSYNKWLNNDSRYNFITSYNLFNNYSTDKCNIELLEVIPFNNKNDLNIRKSYYINSLNTVNKLNPANSRKQNKDKYNLEYRLKNKDKIKENMIKHRIKNKDKIRVYAKEYYLKNIIEIKNKRKINNYAKNYRMKNKDSINEKMRAYERQHKDKRRIYSKNYNKKNKDKMNECTKRYYYRNKNKIKMKKYILQLIITIYILLLLIMG